MQHIFLSPHLDDVIASCGGTISQIVKERSESVTIFNLFAGEVEPPYSSNARYLHELWGNPPNIVRLRRAEDLAAATRLGASVHFEDIPELLYRKRKDGCWMLKNREDKWKTPDIEDEALIPHLTKKILDLIDPGESCIYAPLSIGNHVDHRLAFEVGRLLTQKQYKVIFYEDFPYASDENMYNERMSSFANWKSYIVRFKEQHLLSKIEACSYYHTQISMLFENIQEARIAFIEFSKKVSGVEGLFGERYWKMNNEHSNSNIL